MTSHPRFLSASDVLALHAIAIEDQGGDPSLRDRALLESAVAMPAQQFDGRFLHEDIPSMAAAYAFHICTNHPFVDGNKRAGVAAMIAFLADNGWAFEATADEAEPQILRLAAGRFDKAGFTEWARKHMREKPRLELRDFMASVRYEDLRRHFEAFVASPRPAESHQTTLEACRHIPCLAEIELSARVALNARDEDAFRLFDDHAALLTALYRIAEDMGYEW